MTTVLAAESNNFLFPNATIVVELVLFVIVFFVFARFIVPPLAKAMKEREEMVKKQAADRAESAKRLEAAKERYDASLAEARTEATAIRDEARADAQRIREEMRAETDREVERIRAEGEEQLAAQREQATAQLRGEIGGLSTDLASRILGSPMGQDGPERSTIDAFLADLDDRGQRQTTGRQTAGGAG